MAPTPTQLAWRERIEAGLRIAEPVLNLVLATGDRVSTWVDRKQPDAYVPARRLSTEAEEPRPRAISEAR